MKQLLLTASLFFCLMCSGQWTPVTSTTQYSDLRTIVENDSMIMLFTGTQSYLNSSLNGGWVLPGYSKISGYVQVGDSLFLSQSSSSLELTQYSNLFSSVTYYPWSINDQIDYRDGVMLSVQGLEGCYYSIDDGQSFNSFNSGLPTVSGGAGGLFTPVRDLAHTDSYYFVAGHNGIFRSDSVSVSWVEKSNGLPNSPPQRIKNYNDTLYTCVGTGFYKSSDFGENWSLIYSAGNNVHNFIKHNESFFLSVSQTGIHASIDSGQSWSTLNYGLYTGLSIYDIKVYKDTLLCINENGLWKLPLSVLNQELAVQESIQKNFSINVFPNPSNGNLTIQCSELCAQKRKVEVLDLSGRVVFSGDYFESTINLKLDLDSGLYVVRVDNSNNTFSSRKILIK